ncbi:MAG: hypothetical protein MK074_04700 [Phycisphaerales bacterium]|nr:hypothetical protein [Phycisphaerales bacterium]
MATTLNTRRIWTSLLALTALIAGGAAAATALEEPLPPEADFYYVGSDDERAAQLLHDCLQRDPNFSNVTVLNDVVAFQFEGFSLYLRPVMFRGIRDRVALIDFQTGKRGNEDDCAALKFANELNETQSMATYSWDKDGDLRMSTSITFDNLLVNDQIRDLVARHLALKVALVMEHEQRMRRFLSLDDDNQLN